MEPKRNFYIPIFFLAADLVLLTGVYYLSAFIWPQAWSQEKFVFHVLLWLVPLTWTVVSFIINIYDDKIIQVGRSWNIKRISAGFFFLLVIVLMVVVFGKFKLSRSTLLLYLLLNYLALLGSGYIRHRFLGYIRSLGYNPRRIIFVGSQEEIKELKDWIAKHPERGFQYTHFIRFSPDEEVELLVKKIRNIADAEPLEELALGAFHELYPNVIDLIDLAEEYGLRVFLHSTIPDEVAKKSGNVSFGPFSVIRVRQEPLNRIRARVIKRIVDLSITIPLMLLVFWWFYLLAAILIKTSSRGPVVFKQRRIGADGEPFMCYKFRTMRLNEPHPDGVIPLTREKDKRITWVGKILRATNLDELPQFINVIKGEMSVAGPRPHMVEEDEAISGLLRSYKIRRFVKPGITGWAAIHGYRGGTEDLELMQARTDHDIHYIENWTPWLDTKIFFVTVWKMLTLTTGGK